MSRGDGLEIDAAISSTALSLQYLHFCKFWRYFIQFNYHSGSAREAISTSSPNAFHHLRLTRNLRRKLPSKQGRLNFLCCIRPYTSLLTSRLIRFSWLFYQDSISLVRGTTFFALKWETSSQTSKPSERILSNFCTFSMSRHFPIPFTRSPSVFSPHLLPVEHSNLAASSSSPLRLFVPELRTPSGWFEVPLESEPIFLWPMWRSQ